MKEKLKSRKLWTFVGTVLLGAIYPPIIPLLTIAAPTYIGGQAAVDAAAAFAAARAKQQQ